MTQNKYYVCYRTWTSHETVKKLVESSEAALIGARNLEKLDSIQRTWVEDTEGKYIHDPLNE